jgi:hypothetical protein
LKGFEGFENVGGVGGVGGGSAVENRNLIFCQATLVAMKKNMP